MKIFCCENFLDIQDSLPYRHAIKKHVLINWLGTSFSQINLHNDYTADGTFERELRNFTAEHLSDYLQPVRYFFVEDLPHTATGKVQRVKLRSRLLRKTVCQSVLQKIQLF